MTKQTTYRIEELATSGWEQVGERPEDYSGLTREQTKEKLLWLIEHEGLNPGRLRAIPE
tara:strand:- start:36 stop:212 length:177 start_codon:yes stop_codon:yes gene_type:complete